MALLGAPAARLVAGLVMGGLLGAIGLPRMDLSGLQGALGSGAGREQAASLQTEPSPTTELASTSASPTPEPGPTPVAAASTPTTTPAAPEATSAGAPTGVPRVLIDEHFGSPLPGWFDDPEGTAWFPGGGFHLFARRPNRFVAVGVPLPGAVGDAVLTAQFRKLGGPAGGGYGLIFRDQSPLSERDGQRQDGQYLLVEVGDRGDIGVWQRDQMHWIDVVPWTHSDAVHTGMDSNAIVVTTRGPAVRFSVNGQVVADLTYDGLPPGGGVGVFAGGDLNQVALEWLRIEG